jgi:hypothetical protein
MVLRPVIPPEAIQDQYAFKPSGSTTCALVHFVHHITHMLENNSYVRCLMIDLSKACDTVDHIVGSKARSLSYTVQCSQMDV